MLPETLSHALLILRHLSLDFIRFFCNLLKPRSALAAENLFLRKQLALYHERQVRPQRATDARKVKIFSRCSNICFHITCTGKLNVHFRLFLQIDNRLLMPDAVLLSQTSIG